MVKAAMGLQGPSSYKLMENRMENQMEKRNGNGCYRVYLLCSRGL